MVSLYDETRIFDAECFRAVLDALIERFPPQYFPHLFEPGVGNGRIAMPLAESGYRVTGADISAAMLHDGARRAPRLPVAWHRADAARLPYADTAFDLAVATHLFYFIRDWQQTADEVLRVVRPGGAVILMHTGTGAEIPVFNARYKALCAEMGHPIPTIGVESTREVVDYYASRGCEIEWWRDRWTWTVHIRLDVALRYIEKRAYSFTTFAPEAVHKAVVDRLRLELREEYGSRKEQMDVPNQIYMVIVSR